MTPKDKTRELMLRLRKAAENDTHPSLLLEAADELQKLLNWSERLLSANVGLARARFDEYWRDEKPTNTGFDPPTQYGSW